MSVWVAIEFNRYGDDSAVTGVYATKAVAHAALTASGYRLMRLAGGSTYEHSDRRLAEIEEHTVQEEEPK